MSTTTQPGDFETAFSLFTALEATADRCFNPGQQIALEGFDDFSDHDPDQSNALLAVDITTSADAAEPLARLADLLQRLSH